eukprot:GAHX01001535.1.p1 GENE.GAHX01001535.1~~GAHX01001535.1.p1  ORF type:complete len:835 (-),score=212.38 GAHX01001535.1:35-2539(-)
MEDKNLERTNEQPKEGLENTESGTEYETEEEYSEDTFGEYELEKSSALADNYAGEFLSIISKIGVCNNKKEFNKHPKHEQMLDRLVELSESITSRNAEPLLDVFIANYLFTSKIVHLYLNLNKEKRKLVFSLITNLFRNVRNNSLYFRNRINNNFNVANRKKYKIVTEILKSEHLGDFLKKILIDLIEVLKVHPDDRSEVQSVELYNILYFLTTMLYITSPIKELDAQTHFKMLNQKNGLIKKLLSLNIVNIISCISLQATEEDNMVLKEVLKFTFFLFNNDDLEVLSFKNNNNNSNNNNTNQGNIFNVNRKTYEPSLNSLKNIDQIKHRRYMIASEQRYPSAYSITANSSSYESIEGIQNNTNDNEGTKKAIIFANPNTHQQIRSNINLKRNKIFVHNKPLKSKFSFYNTESYSKGEFKLFFDKVKAFFILSDSKDVQRKLPKFSFLLMENLNRILEESFGISEMLIKGSSEDTDVVFYLLYLYSFFFKFSLFSNTKEHFVKNNKLPVIDLKLPAFNLHIAPALHFFLGICKELINEKFSTGIKQKAFVYSILSPIFTMFGAMLEVSNICQNGDSSFILDILNFACRCLETVPQYLTGDEMHETCFSIIFAVHEAQKYLGDGDLSIRLEEIPNTHIMEKLFYILAKINVTNKIGFINKAKTFITVSFKEDYRIAMFYNVNTLLNIQKTIRNIKASWKSISGEETMRVKEFNDVIELIITKFNNSVKLYPVVGLNVLFMKDRFDETELRGLFDYPTAHRAIQELDLSEPEEFFSEEEVVEANANNLTNFEIAFIKDFYFKYKNNGAVYDTISLEFMDQFDKIIDAETVERIVMG